MCTYTHTHLLRSVLLVSRHRAASKDQISAATMKVDLTELQRHFGWSMPPASQQGLEASKASKEGGCRIHAVANLRRLLSKKETTATRIQAQP